MRKPATIKSWLTSKNYCLGSKKLPRLSLSEKLAIWLTYLGPFHAQDVANMLGVSKQAVWLWLGQYNKHGPAGLGRKDEVGVAGPCFPGTKKKHCLNPWNSVALPGNAYCQAPAPRNIQSSGSRVSLGYVYSLLRRHRWRKLGPRPRHVKAKREIQEEFKKNYQKSSAKK